MRRAACPEGMQNRRPPAHFQKKKIRPPRLPAPERGDGGQALVSLRWEQSSSSTIPWGARDSHALAVFKDALWLMGGLDGNGLVTRDKFGEHVEYWRAPHFDDVWMSTDGYNWKLITDNAPWGKRRSAQAVEFKGKLWLMGGWGPEIGYHSDVWSSEDGVRWEEATAKAEWPAREGHSLAVWQDKLWLIGGVRYDLRTTFSDVWSSADGSNWERVTDNAPWLSRWDHAAVAFQNRLYLTAGMDLRGNTFHDVWVSDDGARWELITNNPPWRERQGHVLLDYRGALWMVGRLNDADSGNGPARQQPTPRLQTPGASATGGQAQALAGGPNDIWFTKDGVAWEKTDADPPWLGREDHGAVVWRDKIWVTGGMDSKWQWGSDVWYSTLEE